ncbi:portal protein [Azospirillum sp. sgz301742]
MTNKNQYFAAQTGDELASELTARIEQFEEIRQPVVRRWRRNLRYYHNQYYENTEGTDSIHFVGEQSEYSAVSVNHFRNIIQHLLNLIVGNRPTFQARATNSDQKSLQQARLANNLLDYYLREKRLDAKIKAAVEYALLLDSGYILTTWDADSGREYGVEDITPEQPTTITEVVPGSMDAPVAPEFQAPPETRQRVVYEGDLRFDVIPPCDVIVDPTKADHSDNTWAIVRRYRSRWDLIVNFPEFEDELREIKSPTEESMTGLFWSNSRSLGTDDIEVFEFFHSKTPALPNGKYALFLRSGTTLLEMPLPYREITLRQISAGTELGTQFGYTVANDLAPLQDLVNMEVSTISTNHATFGVQNVAAARDAGITVKQLEGMNLIEYDLAGGPPQALNLTSTPGEIFQFLNLLVNMIETISGVNSVVRGNPQANLESGTAIALVQQQALEFASHLQESYVRLLEDVGTDAVRILRDFASTPRLVHIAGKSKVAAMREFVGNDLENVNRVVVDLGNPLSRTTAGRVELAHNLINFGIIKTPEEYLTVVETGNLDPLTEHDSAELGLIRHENEMLMEGQGVPSLIIDNHRLHILEHSTILMNPEVRINSPAVGVVLNHIQEHMGMLNDAGVQQIHALLGNTTGQPQMAPSQVPPQPEPMKDVQGGGVPVQGPMPPRLPAGAAPAASGPMNAPPAGPGSAQ